jgi:hypothetical protein
MRTNPGTSFSELSLVPREAPVSRFSTGLVAVADKALLSVELRLWLLVNHIVREVSICHTHLLL